MNIKISVRDLVEFVYRSGSIDATYRASKQEKAMQLGVQLHNKFQRLRKKESKIFQTKYEKERVIKLSYEKEGFNFNISGRIDGIIYGKETTTLEELKTTSKPLKLIETPSKDYLSQLKMYGYMYLKETGLKKIILHLTYINVIDESTKVFDYTMSIEELENFFDEVINLYLKFAKLEKQILNDFLETSKTVTFPHKYYRKNQYQLMGSVYRAIEHKKNIFIEAPTGTGKTISTIFPSIKALEQNLTEKVFYATAKTITRAVALESLTLLSELGLKMPSIVLRSKDKNCILETMNCSPEFCEYAKGHLDRVNDALYDIMSSEKIISNDILIKYSNKHKVCPHEFSLDITTFCYFIVCDYNNIYDPKSKLKRFFLNGGSYSLLFDEAHNLQDRAIDMFSVTFSTSLLKNISQQCLKTDTKPKKHIKKIENFFNDFKNTIEPYETIVSNELSQSLVYNVYDLKKSLDELIEQNHKNSNALTEHIFELLDFLRISEFFGTNYKTIITREHTKFTLTLQCIDVAPFLRETNSVCDGVVYFSATLTPLDFYRESFGSAEDDYTVKLSSPFEEKNCLYMIDDTISTYYKTRNRSIQSIAEKIFSSTKIKRGNYFVFFNSYEHLKQVLEMFKILYGEYLEDINIVVQNTGLTEDEKEAFLMNFKENPKKTTIGFLVLGGMFSEGIDLVGTRLIGVIVVGVGLPKISIQRELMKDYYKDKDNENGFDYAYTYNGISKVLQGFGRLIRSDTDKGFVLLMDIRYNTPKYLKLLPFSNYYIVKRKEHIENLVSDFWDTIQ